MKASIHYKGAPELTKLAITSMSVYELPCQIAVPEYKKLDFIRNSSDALQAGSTEISLRVFHNLISLVIRNCKAPVFAVSLLSS